LTFTTLDRFTPEPKRVLVADNGSRDGTLRYLRGLPWLTVFSLAERRREIAGASTEHGATLDWLAARVDTPFFMTLDSDVEFQMSGWLGAMLRLAESDNLAALGTYEPPLAGYRARLAPSVLLVRTATYRALNTSLRPFVRILDPVEAARWQSRKPRENLEIGELESYRTASFYPTAAAFFEQLEASGARWRDLPSSIASSFVHLGHMSWASGEHGALQAQHRRQRAYVGERLITLGDVCGECAQDHLDLKIRQARVLAE
jgi:hypothetical protein